MAGSEWSGMGEGREVMVAVGTPWESVRVMKIGLGLLCGDGGVKARGIVMVVVAAPWELKRVKSKSDVRTKRVVVVNGMPSGPVRVRISAASVAVGPPWLFFMVMAARPAAFRVSLAGRNRVVVLVGTPLGSFRVWMTISAVTVAVGRPCASRIVKSVVVVSGGSVIQMIMGGLVPHLTSGSTRPQRTRSS